MPKMFRIAREGKTIDKREITAQQIDEMAESYSPKLYGARIWLEHIRGLFADSAFPALGDVVSLSADTDDTGRRVLLAELSPTAELVKMNEKRQKIFSSIELDPNFSDTGKAYLTGLAVTDSPASTGTEALCFSAQKANATHLFSEFTECPLNFSDQSSDTDTPADTGNTASTDNKPATPSDESKTFMHRIKQLFTKQDKLLATQSEDIKVAFSEIEQGVTLGFTELLEKNDALAQSQADFEEKWGALTDEFNQLKNRLDNEPDSQHYTPREPHNGGDGRVLTDC